MNLSAGVIDQHVRGLASRHRASLEAVLGKTLDDARAWSAAFVALCIQVEHGLSVEQSIFCLTDGGNDLGVDAVVIEDLPDGSFVVSLLQGKYHAGLDAENHFPQSGVEKAVQALRMLFDPQGPSLHVNARLAAQVTKIHARLFDGRFLARVRCLLCSNGKSWKMPEAQQVITHAQLDAFVSVLHLGPEQLVERMHTAVPVNETVQLVGPIRVEDLNHKRILEGRIAMSEIARLLDTHGDLLLERNIRRFLGPEGNPVNAAILAAVRDPLQRADFFHLNNGITLVCDSFSYNSLQSGNHSVRALGLKIINGGQTCKIIQHVLGSRPRLWEPYSEGEGWVKVELLQVLSVDDELVRKISFTINHQTAVDQKDLHSDDEQQKLLETSIRLLGHVYRRHSVYLASDPSDISVTTAAESVLAVWRRAPQRARVLISQGLNAVYRKVFTEDLNGAQVVIAVLLLRTAWRELTSLEERSLELGELSAGYLAQLMGQQLLEEMGLSLSALDHRCFESAKSLVEQQGARYFQEGLRVLSAAVMAHKSAAVSLVEIEQLLESGTLLKYLPGHDSRLRSALQR